jgi:hypothetical protein
MLDSSKKLESTLFAPLHPPVKVSSLQASTDKFLTLYDFAGTAATPGLRAEYRVCAWSVCRFKLLFLLPPCRLIEGHQQGPAARFRSRACRKEKRQ